MRTYTSKANCKDDMLRRERLLIRDCVLIGSNTMMRVGELWQLQFGDIVGSQEVEDENGRKLPKSYVCSGFRAASNRDELKIPLKKRAPCCMGVILR